MRRRRIVLPAGAVRSGSLTLPEAAAHHVQDVLRAKGDDQLSLADGEGVVADAVIRSVGSKVEVDVGPTRTVARPRPEVTSILSVVKRDKMDGIVRQVTELGVARIRPVVTERSSWQAKRDPEAQKAKLVERWRRIAEDALRVSGREHRPRIDPPVLLSTLLKTECAALMLSFQLGAESLRTFLHRRPVPETMAFLIGPEGGLTQEEGAQVAASGFLPVGFGEHTLRVETAAPAALTAILFWAGCFE